MHKVYLTDKILPGSSVVSLVLPGQSRITFRRGEEGGTVRGPFDLTPAQVAELEAKGYNVKQVADEKPAGRKPVAAAAEDVNQAGEPRKRRGDTDTA